MQRQVHRCEVQLPQHLASGAIGASRLDLVEEFVGQPLARVDMLRKTNQRLTVVAPVFHELTRQFDGVPLDISNSGCQAILDTRQHVLQAMSKFMEERQDFVEGHL